MRRLADREDDVVDELRQHEHVGDVGVQRLVEQRTGGGRRDDDDRRPRLFADRGDLGRRERLGPRAVKHAVEVAAGQDAGSLSDMVAPADDLEIGVAGEGLAKVGEAVTVAREVEACGLSVSLVSVIFRAPA